MNTDRTHTAPVPNALPWLTVSALVIAVDQASKYWVLATLPEYTAVPVIEGVWNWYRSYNTGAAFSFLSDAGGWQQVVLSLLALAISGLLAYWLYRMPRSAYGTAVPYALVIGGALSNVVDRLLRGHVVDFIQWYWRDYYWPTFNLSDSAIVAGAIAMILHGSFGSPRASAPPAAGPGEPT